MAFSGGEADDAAEALDRSLLDRRTSRLVTTICVVGLCLTGLGVWGAVRTDRNVEQRLLETQTRQAATVLAAAVGDIQQPLMAAMEVQATVLVERRREVFRGRFARHVGPKGSFVSASLWQVDRDGATQLAAVGDTPALKPTGVAATSFVRRALTADTSIVRRVAVGQESRIAYALGDRPSGLVIYAERAIPADRRAPVDRDSAFADLEYAIYFGTRIDDSAVTTTNVSPASLPLTGTTYKTSVPFGDTVLTLVTRPRRHLGSELNERMPWYVLFAGLMLTAITAAVARQTVQARMRAESDTRTIRNLYERVDTLFGEQRDLSIGLQRALLPRYIPDVPGLQIAAEYMAGASGIDIGGDWYSVIGTGDDTFAFVVGDVSGHGIDAVAEMAHARFTVRAYLLDGNPPHIALEKCSHQFDVVTDGHIVTVIAGIGNVRTGEVTLANAGHPRPLCIRGDGSSEFVETAVGPPLGVGATCYEASTFTLPQDAILLCYTDGLIERRGEEIEVGLDRLATTAAASQHRADPAELLRDLLGAMRDDEAADDIALLALKRGPQGDAR
jgi:serine phosphatase RsbU (regulator of sigma subunit)